MDYLEGLWKQGYNIFVLSYRGFNLSTGKPSERGIKQDAQAALEFLATNCNLINPHKIIVLGISLGGAIAIDLVARNQEKFGDNIKGLIVENTCTSISDMVDVAYPFFKFFKWMFLRLDFDSLKCIEKIQTPILFI